ncbi:MAG TPA: tetratricopeptide repeat protein, partial [Rhizobiaceae bacterium]|nr:tetratricopeptide repeat protein [Rhizobiaceae bacterium]
EQAFDKALALRPDHPKALFFLGLARAQQNDVAAARQIWTKVAASGKDWAGAATSAIAELDQRNPQVATGGAAPKIDDETMAAAADMDKDAQRQMIDGMIARLDERLRGQPDDSEGWKRLIRAYVVLGDKAKAADALARAVGAFTVTDARRDEILAFARDLGVETQETTTQ